jgi:methionyl aminopeptidase
VVRDYVGHGIGRVFHTAPQVPHFGKRGEGKRVKTGMVFTIEPMINLGDYHCQLLSDGWTVLTGDRSLSAQFEHTIVVTDTGCEVLTARKAPLKHSEDKPWSVLGPLSSGAALRARELAQAAAQ